MSSIDGPGGPLDAAGVLAGFLASLETFDPDEILPWFHSDAVIEFPFAVEGRPKRHEGTAELTRFFGWAAQMFSTISFLDVQVWPLVDPSMAVGEFRSSGVLARSLVPFGNRYIVTATARDGRLSTYREFYDPQAVIRAAAGGSV
jgi:ketosteroid isomerase-like protein